MHSRIYMPITAQAIKKLRHDRKRQKVTAARRTSVRDAVKAMRKTPTQKQLSTTFQVLDKAVKIHVIHANKASRLKSRLAALLGKK